MSKFGRKGRNGRKKKKPVILKMKEES